ncbi:MAG: hypothetical protein AAF495_07605 [Pseudomonadota bacterium]
MAPERDQATRPTVVKLGGSLAHSPELGAWLDRLLRHPCRAVLVPGGGPFADQVRELQVRLAFDETAAHGLAIGAMALFGQALAALRPGMVLADSAGSIERALGEGHLPVWDPAAMTLGRAEIPESWEVTSDSLAAWLAGRLGAPRLVLIKSAPRPAESANAQDLAASGLVDAAFPGFLARAPRDVWLLGPGQQDLLDMALSGQAQPGSVRLVLG